MHLSLPLSESIHIAYHILSLIIFTNIQVLSYITELKSLYVPRLAMYYVGSLCSIWEIHQNKDQITGSMYHSICNFRLQTIANG